MTSTLSRNRTRTRPSWSAMGMELDLFMRSNRPYLLHQYSLQQMSQDSGIAVARLSVYINKTMGLSYTDFINEYRIRYCQEYLQRIRPRTISALDLSVICGFSDQKSFSTCFKKTVNISPEDYIKRLYEGKPF